MGRLDKARVIKEYRAQYPDPIRAAAGTTVTVGRVDNESPGWIWCQAPDGRKGWVPIELLSRQGAEAVLLEDYSAVELEVKSGDEVSVEDARHGWVLVRNARGERGWIPSSHLESRFS